MEDIETLIAQRRVITLAELIDITNDYVIVGVWQAGTSKSRGDGTSYKNYAMPISELAGGGTSPTIDNYVQTWFFQVQSNRVGVGSSMPSSSPLLRTSLHCFPFRLPSLLTAKTIAVDYRGGGNASFKLKVGIYKLNQGTLVWESPEITVTAIATYAINGLDVDLPEGIYYFAVSHNSTTAITLRGGLADNTIPVMENGYGSISGNITNRLTFSPYVYSPTLPPLLSAVSGGNPQNNTFIVPYIYFKI